MGRGGRPEGHAWPHRCSSPVDRGQAEICARLLRPHEQPNPTQRPAWSKTLMSETTFCYHCGIHHPVEEMRQILTKSGRRWRCIKSIELTKQGSAKREA